LKHRREKKEKRGNRGNGRRWRRVEIRARETSKPRGTQTPEPAD